jgi:hypothetical protein
MNLENISIEELIDTAGGSGDVLVTGGNGDYFDDGSGQGCIPDIGLPKFGFPI